MGPARPASLRLTGDINVTPMIDVLLVLFIIFLMVQQIRTAIPIQVPPPANPEPGVPAGSAPPIVLELRDDGSYAINERVVPYHMLSGRLTELYLERPVKLLFVRAAPQRRYGEVIDAVDVARGAGVQVVGFAPYQPHRQ